MSHNNNNNNNNCYYNTVPTQDYNDDGDGDENDRADCAYQHRHRRQRPSIIRILVYQTVERGGKFPRCQKLDDDVDRQPTKTVLRKEYRREDQYLCIEIQP